MAVLSEVRMTDRQIFLMERMLGIGRDTVRGFRGARNWLLVREGSSDHQQLLSLCDAGLVWMDAAALSGFVRWHATSAGCWAAGLSDSEVRKAVR